MTNSLILSVRMKSVIFCLTVFLFSGIIEFGNVAADDDIIKIHNLCPLSMDHNNLIIFSSDQETKVNNDSLRYCRCTIAQPKFALYINCQDNQYNNKNFEAEHLPAFTDRLDISWNEFDLSPMFIGEDLRTLDLSHNQITRIDDRNFQQIPKLQELNLSWNQISRLSIGAFNGIAELKKLDLSRNQIKKITVNVFSTLPHLVHLNLSRNRFLNETFNQQDVNLFLSLGVTPKLEILEMEDCDLNIIDLTDGVGLKVLHLKYNRFEKMPQISRGIERLDFSGNPIQRIESKFLPILNDLRELLLMDMPNLTTVDEWSLYGLPHLKVINFEGSWVLNDFDSMAFGTETVNTNETDISIRELNLRGTNLKSLNSSYVMKHLNVLDLAGAPIVCDCDVRWLVEWTNCETNAECVSPVSLRGQRLSDLSVDDLKCKRWSSWVYKMLNGLLVMLLLIMCGVATWLIVTGIRPSRRGQLQKVGAASPYARVTIEPNLAENVR